MAKKHTAIELFIIKAVKKRRLELKINPSRLSKEIGLNRTFVGKIEKLELGNRYSVNQLNEIAKVLHCNVADFFPLPYMEEDCVEEFQTIHPPKARIYDV